MAIDLCSEDSSLIMSPRLSFSGDDDVSPVTEQDNIRITSSSSSIDFDFFVFPESSDYCESSSADELFLDGKILPIDIIKTRIGYQRQAVVRPPPLPLPPPLPPPVPVDIVDKSKNAKCLDEHKQSSKPWKFRRSSSLSCGSSALCPLPLLSRSNSTGSSSPINPKPYHKKFSSSSSSGSAVKQSHYWLSNGHHHHHQKPPLKKLQSNNSRMRINPVLNIPQGGLFGLSSIFSGGKDKNKKKL